MMRGFGNDVVARWNWAAMRVMFPVADGLKSFHVGIVHGGHRLIFCRPATAAGDGHDVDHRSVNEARENALVNVICQFGDAVPRFLDDPLS